MKNLFIKSFNILKSNLLYIQPLLLYMFFTMALGVYLLSKNVLYIPKVCLLVSIFLLTAAFLSGWFYINKQAVIDYNPDDDNDTIVMKSVKNFKLFFSGVGELFFKVLTAAILYLIFYCVLGFLILKLGNIYLGHPVIFDDLPKIADKGSAELINYLNSVSYSDKLIFTKWMCVITFLSILMNFFGVLYYSVITFERGNIFYLLLKTIIFLFKNLGGCIVTVAVMFVLYLLLNIVSILFGSGSIAFLLLIILFSLYLNYYIILVLCFYYEKTKINSGNGAEFIG